MFGPSILKVDRVQFVFLPTYPKSPQLYLPSMFSMISSISDYRYHTSMTYSNDHLCTVNSDDQLEAPTITFETTPATTLTATFAHSNFGYILRQPPSHAQLRTLATTSDNNFDDHHRTKKQLPQYTPTTTFMRSTPTTTFDCNFGKDHN